MKTAIKYNAAERKLLACFLKQDPWMTALEFGELCLRAEARTYSEMADAPTLRFAAQAEKALQRAALHYVLAAHPEILAALEAAERLAQTCEAADANVDSQTPLELVRAALAKVNS